MRFLVPALVILGGSLPAVFGSPSPQNKAPSSQHCSRHPKAKECKTTATSATSTPTPPPPPGCDAGPFHITSFTWFNPSSNLNCPLASDPNNLCFTGRDPQPLGYGPPDNVSFNVKNVATSRSSSCIYQNPGSVPDTGEPGRAGLTKCSTGDQTFVFTFNVGPSNGMGGSATADLTVADRQSSCK